MRQAGVVLFALWCGLSMAWAANLTVGSLLFGIYQWRAVPRDPVRWLARRRVEGQAAEGRTVHWVTGSVGSMPEMGFAGIIVVVTPEAFVVQSCVPGFVRRKSAVYRSSGQLWLKGSAVMDRKKWCALRSDPPDVLPAALARAGWEIPEWGSERPANL